MPYLIIIFIMSVVFMVKSTWTASIAPLEKVVSADKSLRVDGWVHGYLFYIFLISFVNMFARINHPHYIFPSWVYLLLPGLILGTATFLGDKYRAIRSH